MENCEFPKGLRSHLAQEISRSLSSLQLDPYTLEAFAHSFLDHILVLGWQQCPNSDLKDFNRWLAHTGEVVSKCFEIHPHIASRAVGNELSVQDVIKFWMKSKDHNEKIFENITNHHQSLITFGWNHLLSVEDSTQSYAIAAAEMGKKDWVREINEWMEIQVVKYFRLGGSDSLSCFSYSL
jgi:hypothetical protein